jgi:hypothetical protein
MPTANVNGYEQGNTYIGENNLARTNPYADEGNALQLYGVDTLTDRHSVAFTWTVSSAGDQVRFTPSTGATTATDYLKFRIQDQSGNEAYSTGFQSSAATANLDVNTSGLNPNDDWAVLFQTSNNDGATKVKFQFTIATGAIYGNSSAAVAYTLT